ncbi:MULTISPECIES: LCP family protein [Nocardiopsis]|uniref:LytR family transcriptional regulator n=1 Tax=Nocardiopsis sinuspersici TaxID=501010 RepID=A0A1V3BXX9_9ACTN|nr:MULTISPECIES: LCP family protein [Nocardiopsis]OOC53414.1 LytR family transcriptional regulator [Nocardiopsis sinuspersici]
MAAEDDQRDGAPARPSTGRALLWTAASVPLPGLAHLRMRRRVAGTVILGLYLSMVLGLAAWGWWLVASETGTMTLVATMALQSRWLLSAMGLVFGVAVLWLTVIVHSWVITRPAGASRGSRVLGAAMVLLLCLTVATPSALALHGGYTAYQTLNNVFQAEEDPLHPPHDEADPWNGQERVNVLLLGSDSADNRYGVRTDSMMIASMDTSTGDTVLVGLPRNLENARFPEGSALAERYPEPYGFDMMLNELYQVVAEEPEALAFRPSASDPSADTLKKVIAHNVGLEIGYYAMVDMMGFRDLIDAIGGVEVLIEEPIPYGVHGGVLEPGLRRLNGHDALWYGRSRTNSDDYGRMGRQGCLLKYVAEQVEPTTVLTSYRKLAGATERTLSTDIPQAKVPAFVELADMVTDKGEMSTLQLSPPQVSTADPDWEEVRKLVDEAIAGEEAGDGAPTDEASGSPSPGASDEPSGPAGEETGDDGLTEWQEYTGLDEERPDEPGRQVGEDPTALEALCP